MITGAQGEIAAFRQLCEKLEIEGQLWFQTSGTTGAPKMVGLTTEMIAARVARVPIVYPEFAAAHSLFVAAGGASGFRDCLYAAQSGKELALPSESHRQSAEQLSRCDAARIAGADAHHYVEIFCKQGMRKVPFLVVNGKVLAHDLAADLLAHVCERGAVSYGLTEFGTVARAPLSAPLAGRYVPASDLSLAIENGEIVVNGFGTGDAGHLDERGLVILGRLQRAA
jgi:hypothetical protein